MVANPKVIISKSISKARQDEPLPLFSVSLGKDFSLLPAPVVEQLQVK